MAGAAVRLARGIGRAGLSVRFRRRGDGLLELLFDDGSSITLDLHENEFIEAYGEKAALASLQEIICDSLGWPLEKPEADTDSDCSM
ncbi:hypothetical protein LV82_02624 [Albidovulum inexpectatum]|uniref:Uncharacterized protein n=1 Tax=Albidovulum inexpectatum TaxID=196587 RepID=A0A2S5JEH7_9RHOB|nr:hypothetical protein [Albidovulum inexpectatum]PPB79831.1 hypothetical protein LV82_02624 [Albidovulum inexpectatum]